MTYSSDALECVNDPRIDPEEARPVLVHTAAAVRRRWVVKVSEPRGWVTRERLETVWERDLTAVRSVRSRG